MGVEFFGKGKVPGRVAVGGGTEDVEVRGEAEAPGVVGGILKEFDGAAVRLEAEEPGGKFDRLATDSAVEPCVAFRGVDPVVEAVAKV